MLSRLVITFLPRSKCLLISWLQSPSSVIAAAAAKSLQSCLTLWDPIDGSLPGSPVPGILQARILEWVTISFSNAWKWKVKVKLLSRVSLLATPWTAAYQARPARGFYRQEYWSGVLLPSPLQWLVLLNFNSISQILSWWNPKSFGFWKNDMVLWYVIYKSTPSFQGLDPVITILFLK